MDRGHQLAPAGLVLVIALCGCRSDPFSLGVHDPAGSATGASATGTTSGSDGGTSGQMFDVSNDTDPTGAGGACKPIGDGDAVDPCEDKAPPASFQANIQWLWEGVDEDIDSIVTPLVANMTDDNGDGEIDLCDIPDVLVVAGDGAFQGQAHMYILSGDTGEMRLRIKDIVISDVTPAIGDIDGDGLPEIVGGKMYYLFSSPGANLAAWDHDGTLKWETDGISSGGSIGLADLDQDGDVEIYTGGTVFDHEGVKQWSGTGSTPRPASTAADLDGEPGLELVLGLASYHADGTVYWTNEDVTTMQRGYPQVANLDDDDEPEILVATWEGFWVLDHDGTQKLGPLTPTNESTMSGWWDRPATIHDFDGDGEPEFALAAGRYYATYERDGTLIWQAEIVESNGLAGSTAFDFLGDGTAEAMFADQSDLYIFDSMGNLLMKRPRTSNTLIEYPIVADIDNDLSAEIVVVSNTFGAESSPTVQVIRDSQDRWIQARRIWNQHSYHVTNVNEDGTIPQFEQPHWRSFNTFRTNAQIEDGRPCKPPPEG